MTFPRVVELDMNSRISCHVHINEMLVTEQDGFRKGMYIENATFKLTYSVFQSVNQNMCVRGIFCDLTKHFDHINHAS
jgi:hypothetical protein